MLLIGLRHYANFSDESGATIARRTFGSLVFLVIFGGIAWLVRRRDNPQRTSSTPASAGR